MTGDQRELGKQQRGRAESGGRVPHGCDGFLWRKAEQKTELVLKPEFKSLIQQPSAIGSLDKERPLMLSVATMRCSAIGIHAREAGDRSKSWDKAKMARGG